MGDKMTAPTPEQRTQEIADEHFLLYPHHRTTSPTRRCDYCELLQRVQTLERENEDWQTVGALIQRLLQPAGSPPPGSYQMLSRWSVRHAADRLQAAYEAHAKLRMAIAKARL